MSLIKFKYSYSYNEKEEHSNIQWMNDCSPSLQYGQTFGQLSKTLPLLITIVVLYLKPDLNHKIQLKPKLN